MLTVAEALELVWRHAAVLPPVLVPVDEVLGLTLMEPIVSDIDSPPYDKAMVDGYAVRSADLAGGSGELTLLEEIVAGAMPTQPIVARTCSRVMTGAPLPEGADAMVMLEQTECLRDETSAAERVRFNDAKLCAGQNIMRRGMSLRRGETVLEPGCKIRPIEIGLLAEVGRTSILASPRICVAVLSTGNELVEPGATPTGSQIRNSNGPLLAAAVRQAGAAPVELGTCRDEVAALREKIAEGLQAHILVVSGGVSAGVLDLAPSVFAELGVTQVFHKVRLKPGKPIWFGIRANPGQRSTLVFGLPGNPVSSFVCFELFVREAIAALSGRKQGLRLRIRSARLAAEFAHRGDRPTYHPASLEIGAGFGAANIHPLRWAGSADLRGLAAANALIAFPAGDRTFAAGEMVEAISLDE